MIHWFSDAVSVSHNFHTILNWPKEKNILIHEASKQHNLAYIDSFDSDSVEFYQILCQHFNNNK